MGNRDKVLESARELFNQQGTQSVTTNHIAKAAGVSPGNLYYHFKNKEAIIFELFQEMECCFDQAMPRQVPVVPESLEQLEEQFRLISEAEWNYRFFTREMVTLLEQSAELKTAFCAKQTERTAQIRATIKGMMEKGLVAAMSEEKIGELVQIIWLISVFWNPYLVLSGQEVTRESAARSMQLVRSLIDPYLIKK